MIEITVHGLKELQDALDKLPIEIQERTLRFALRKGANVIAEGAARRAPRDTGKLAEDIVVRTRKDRAKGLVAEIGPSKKVFYGMFQELGTSFHAAQPFLRPALDEEGEKAVKELGSELGKAIERAVKRLAKIRKV